jgi:hypothetical protein
VVTSARSARGAATAATPPCQYVRECRCSPAGPTIPARGALPGALPRGWSATPPCRVMYKQRAQRHGSRTRFPTLGASHPATDGREMRDTKQEHRHVRDVAATRRDDGGHRGTAAALAAKVNLSRAVQLRANVCSHRESIVSASTALVTASTTQATPASMPRITDNTSDRALGDEIGSVSIQAGTRFTGARRDRARVGTHCSVRWTQGAGRASACPRTAGRGAC